MGLAIGSFQNININSIKIMMSIRNFSRGSIQNQIAFPLIVYNIMFESIATLFSTPIIQRSYEQKPSIIENCKLKLVSRYCRVQKFVDKESQDILESLSRPIETWIIQKQPHLRCNALNMAIFSIIAQKAKSRKIVQTGSGNKTSYTHNLFVLVVQYKVLNERIKQMATGQLQLFLNGLCAIYLEQKGPLDELTCLLHFIVSNCKMNESQNLKGNISLFRPLELHLGKMDHFFEVFSNLQQKRPEFIDIVVNIIPMMTELCKIIVKTDNTPAKLYLLEKISWLSKIGIQIIKTIQKDIEDVAAGQQQENYTQALNPCLRKRLFDKGAQLIQIQGIITNKVLFSFAYKQLYYFQHTLRLHRFMMEIAMQSQILSSQQRRNNLQLVNFLLKAVGSYQFNLPDTSIQSLGNILNVSLSEVNDDYSEVLCHPELRGSQLQEFIEDLKCSPLYQMNRDAEIAIPEQQEEFQFYLQKDNSIVSAILQMVFNLKLEYLQLLKIIMKKTNKNYLENLQFYLIKNGLLNFLIQQLQSIQSSDKKSLQNYFKVLSLLLQRNTIAYCMLNEIIQRQIRQNEKSTLVQYIRKNFIHSKQFLFTILSDTITINSKKTTSVYFLPRPLQALLYPANIPPKHDIWISYIHDVILRQLSVKREKQKIKKAYFDQEINEWTMLAIMLQIQHMNCIKGSDIELGQFTMAYLTNVLKEAIKWKTNQTQAMCKLLKSYEEWQEYYTQIIMETNDTMDVIQAKWGPTINFLFLKRWNKKICNSIKLFIESVTNIKTVDDVF